MNRTAKYLGETLVESLDGTPFESYTPRDWALEYIERYGGIDGDHHKAWVLDQIARILCGTPVLVSLARWDNRPAEYRIQTGEPSASYRDWVTAMRDGDHHYDEGLAP